MGTEYNAKMPQYNLRLPAELIDRIKEDAEAHNTTAQRTIRKILKDYYGVAV